MSKIKDAINRVKASQDVVLDTQSKYELGIQKVAEQLLEYFHSDEGCEVMELLSLFPRSLFSLHTRWEMNNNSGNRTSSDFCCSYNSGFFVSSNTNDIFQDWPHWMSRSCRESNLPNLTIEDATRAVKDFDSLSRLSGKDGPKVEEFIPIFKRRIEWIVSRVVSGKFVPCL